MPYHFSSHRHGINISTINSVISSRNLKSNKRFRTNLLIPSIKDLLKFKKITSFWGVLGYYEIIYWKMRLDDNLLAVLELGPIGVSTPSFLHLIKGELAG